MPVREHLTTQPVSFHKSDDGLCGIVLNHRAAASSYSVIGICLPQGIDARKYLVEVAGRLDEPFAASRSREVGGRTGANGRRVGGAAPPLRRRRDHRTPTTIPALGIVRFR